MHMQFVPGSSFLCRPRKELWDEAKFDDNYNVYIMAFKFYLWHDLLLLNLTQPAYMYEIMAMLVFLC